MKIDPETKISKKLTKSKTTGEDVVSAVDKHPENG